MSWWFAPFYDRFMRGSEEASVGEWRRELLSNLEGEVLDVGAGTGANLPYFDREHTHVVAAEPDAGMAKRLRAHAKGHANIEVVSASAGAMPFASGAFDAVVCTLVLCTVPDLDRALAEIHRVLRPGGKLVFLEHVASDDSRILRWQRILDPAWQALAGGCHLTRRTDEAIAHSFTLTNVTREPVRKAMSVVRTSVRGVAVRE
jgi:ubiquinone/menaquinone biosynthesis C-methylase UbiE